MGMRLGKARKTCRFMMEPLEKREMLDGAPLAAPSDVHIVKTFSTSLIVGWTDQSTSESGYRVQRSSDGSSWNTVATVGPNVTSFQESGLTPDSSYSYRVVAFDFMSELSSDSIIATTASQLLQIGYGATGLASISYNGTTLLDTTASPLYGFNVTDYQIKKPDGTTITANGGLGFTSSWNPDTHTLTYEYKGFRLITQYTQDVDNLNLTITVINKSSTNTLLGVNIVPMIIDFSSYPIGYDFQLPHVGYNSLGPTVVSADFHTGTMALTNPDVAGNLYLGFLTHPPTINDQSFLLWVGSIPFWSLPGNMERFNRPLAPGATDQYDISVRFAPTGTTDQEIAPDTYAAAAAQYPNEVHWDDRRPIGIIALAGSSLAGNSLKNPRGYMGDSSFDVRTKSGRARFRKLLMHAADRSIGVLQGMNAQGMIVWDLEGEEYAKINYVGDPRMLADLAPEMEYNGTVDAYFKKFRDAGLRVGVTIRPQRLRFTAKGWRQTPVANPYNILASKISYAHTRWGATLFYVDSNLFKSTIYDASLFQRLQAAFPDIMLIPEWETTRYFAYGAPYQEVRMGEMFTPDYALQAYPTSFSAINATAGDLVANHDALVSSVRQGNILLFHGWFEDSQNVLIKQIYDDAVSG